MIETNIVSAILADGKNAYNVGQPFADVPNAVVQRILLVGGNVEIFAQDANQGYRKSLLSPMVTTLIALAKKSELNEILKSFDTREKITKVIATNDDVWQLDGTVPRDVSTRIVRIGQSEDIVDIVAVPNPGTDLDSAGLVVMFTLLPLSFQSVFAEAPLSSWIEIQQEMVSADDDDEPDENEDDDNEEEDEPVQAVAPARASLIPNVPVAAAPPPPPPAPVNGAATSNPES